MGVGDQNQPQSWLDRLLGSPGGVKTAIDGLRGVLDIHPKNDGGGLGILKDLKDLGFDFPGLLARSQATKADSSFKVGPISLEGVSLTPEVLSSLIQFQQAADSLNYQKAKDESFRDGMQQLIKLVTDSGILNRIGGGIASAIEQRGPGQTISQEILAGSQPGEQIIICPRCGAENKLPVDVGPGTTIKCIGPGCEQSWITEQAQQPKRQAKKRQVEVKEPEPPTINCPSCGQLLDVQDKGLAETIVCPACQKEWVLTSDNVPIKADNPLIESEKLSKAFLRKGEL